MKIVNKNHKNKTEICLFIQDFTRLFVVFVASIFKNLSLLFIIFKLREALMQVIVSFSEVVSLF